MWDTTAPSTDRIFKLTLISITLSYVTHILWIVPSWNLKVKSLHCSSENGLCIILIILSNCICRWQKQGLFKCYNEATNRLLIYHTFAPSLSREHRKSSHFWLIHKESYNGCLWCSMILWEFFWFMLWTGTCLINNHNKTLCRPVRRECSCCRMENR